MIMWHGWAILLFYVVVTEISWWRSAGRFVGLEGGNVTHMFGAFT